MVLPPSRRGCAARKDIHGKVGTGCRSWFECRTGGGQVVSLPSRSTTSISIQHWSSWQAARCPKDRSPMASACCLSWMVARHSSAMHYIFISQPTCRPTERTPLCRSTATAGVQRRLAPYAWDATNSSSLSNLDNSSFMTWNRTAWRATTLRSKAQR